MSLVIYVIDTETTGVDPEKHDVIEASFWRFSDDTQKTWRLRPFNPNTIEKKALSVNKHKEDDILHRTEYGRKTYLEPSDVIQDIEAWMMEDDAAAEDRVFIGHNADFDYRFLQSLWKRCQSEDTFPFGRFVIDTIAIMKFIDLCSNRRRKFYNLRGAVKDFGVPRATAHSAEGDVKMTGNLVHKILNEVKSTIAEKFKDNYSE